MCPNSNLLSAYFDGELPKKYEDQVTDHIAGCEACAREIKKISLLQQRLAEGAYISKQMQERKTAAWKNIERRLLSRSKSPIIYRYVRLPLPAAAVLLVLFVVSGMGVAYLSMQNSYNSDAIAEIPDFTSMEELIGYLESNQHTQTMEMKLPEDPVFLFMSGPTLIPESDYKEAKW